jgi:MFS family permease
MLFGQLTLHTLLLYRNHYSGGDAGASLVGLIPVAAAAATGSLIAAVLTPTLVRRWTGPRALVAVTATVAVLLPAFGLPFVPALTVLASLAVSFGGQGTKIITDTTLQLDIDDDYRGRVFSVNDTGYNLLFVVGLLIGAVVLPPSGVSVIALVGAGLGYGMVALGYALAERRISRRRDRTPPQSRQPAPSSA